MSDRLRIEPYRVLDELGVLDDGKVGLTLAGELDYGNSSALDERLQPIIEEGSAHLVLEVSELNFCDSAGLAVLIAAYRRLTRLGGDMTLRGVQGSLRRIVDITGLGTLFTIEPAR
jgi:anti-sigma B factor antagonist